MIDQKFIDKELKSIFDGDYGADHDWHYNKSSSEIIQRFSSVFDSWDKLHKDTQEKLLRIAVETIMNEFPAEEETIKFSFRYIHLDTIRNAILEKLNAIYIAKYYVRQMAVNKSLYPELIVLVKTNLEKGVYGNYSIEIAALLEIELKPGQR